MAGKNQGEEKQKSLVREMETLVEKGEENNCGREAEQIRARKIIMIILSNLGGVCIGKC